MRMLFNSHNYKNEIFGVSVSSITRKQTVDAVIEAARNPAPFNVAFMPVHSLMVAVKDQEYRKIISQFDIVAPDGQPVRWALNRFQNAQLEDRVYGPDTMFDICAEAEINQLSLYLYGSSPEVLTKLQANLLSQFPNLKIIDAVSPPYGESPESEILEDITAINQSGAHILFVGLGCPKQELFSGKYKEQIQMPTLCVGAAFDFHAGTLAQAPSWMQKRGLEWLYRLIKEPRRLFKRYFLYNSSFICRVIIESIRGEKK